ncbi:MAG: uroporphyrinogen decarboxylase family protein [Acidobacteria bacterium]|nr:uroporphyrinogen decarboxylase family protein [Acidobacteriota bacterium]
MMDTRFGRFVMDFPGRLAMPIGAYAGLEITGESVEDVVSVPGSQFKAVMALHDRYRTPVLLTAMDPSAEAEAYGCEIRMPEREIPTVVGRLVTNEAEIAALPDPVPGDARTRVPLETAWRLVAEADGPIPVLGCMLGPFSLAGRLYGVSEAIETTVREPETIDALLRQVTAFLCQYALAFRETGAWGVIVSEPTAGLLSPAGLGRFSAPYVRRIVEAAETPEFSVILHNCNAKIIHLESILESGAGIYHFGAPMDIVAALERVSQAGPVAAGGRAGGAGGEVIIGGNLDPTSVFQKGTPQAVGEATRALLEATRSYKNFILSSGCNIPPGTPLASLNAFYRAVAEFNK